MLYWIRLWQPLYCICEIYIPQLKKKHAFPSPTLHFFFFLCSGSIYQFFKYCYPSGNKPFHGLAPIPCYDTTFCLMCCSVSNSEEVYSTSKRFTGNRDNPSIDTVYLNSFDGPSMNFANREQHTAFFIIFLHSFLHPPKLCPLLMIISRQQWSGAG